MVQRAVSRPQRACVFAAPCAAALPCLSSVFACHAPPLKHADELVAIKTVDATRFRSLQEIEQVCGGYLYVAEGQMRSCVWSESVWGGEAGVRLLWGVCMSVLARVCCVRVDLCACGPVCAPACVCAHACDMVCLCESACMRAHHLTSSMVQFRNLYLFCLQYLPNPTHRFRRRRQCYPL